MSEPEAPPAADWEVYHAVRAACHCGYQAELVRCSCRISRDVSWAESIKDPHDGLASAKEAIGPHLEQTGHRLPTLEHRFVYSAGDDVRDFRTWDEALKAGEPEPSSA